MYLDNTLLNPDTTLRPISHAPLSDNLFGGKDLGEGSIVRDSQAWYFDKTTGLMKRSPYNICLQSRTLETSPWANLSSTTLTRNEVGIDGVANTAWTLEDVNAGANSAIKQEITIPADSNTNIFSVFVKKDNDETRFPEFQIYYSGGTTKSTGGQINTKTGATTIRFGTGSITTESAGDWWKVSLTLSNTGTDDTIDIRVYPAISTTLGGAAVTTIGSIVVDKVQVELNQSTPAEDQVTTTTAANGGPRFETNGLLLEGAGFNALQYSREIDTSPWGKNSTTLTQDQIGLDGVANSAWTIDDSSAIATGNILQNMPVPDDSNMHSVSLFVKKDSDETRFPEVAVTLSGGGTLYENIQLNTSTGAVAQRNGTDSYVIDHDATWWRVVVRITNNSSGNIALQVLVRPAATGTLGNGLEVATLGSIVADQAQVELNQAYPTSPIVSEAHGADLVVNGDFSAGNPPTSWSAVRATLATVAGDMQVTATENYGYGHPTTDIVTVVGNVYKLTFDHGNDAGDTAQFQVYDSDNSADIISRTDLVDSQVAYSNVVYFTATGTTTRIIFIAKLNTDVAYFDNVVLHEVTAVRATEAGSATNGVSWDLPDVTEKLGTELIINGDMEIGDPPAAWVGNGSNVTAADTERTGGSGSQSLKLTMGAAPPQWAASQAAIPLVEGKYYKISGWLKNGTATNVYLVANNVQSSAVTDTSWTYIEMYFVSDGVIKTAYLGVSGVEGETGFFDDVSVKEVKPQAVPANITDSLAEVLGDDIVTDGGFDVEGSELITNGTFTSDTTGWTAGNATLASVAGGQAGNCLDIENDIENAGYAYQVVTTEIGKTYKLTVYQKNAASTVKVVVDSTSPTWNGDLIAAVQGSATWAVVDYYFVATSVTSVVTLYVNSTITADSTQVDSITFTEVGADWTLSSGWSIAAGVATCDGTSNVIQQTLSPEVVLGRLYKITFDITARTAGSIKVLATGIFAGTNTLVSTVGTHEFYNVAYDTTAFGLYSSAFAGSIDNVTIEEVLVPSQGTMVFDVVTGFDEFANSSNDGHVSVNDSDGSLAYLDYNSRLAAYDGVNANNNLSPSYEIGDTLVRSVVWGSPTNNQRYYIIGYSKNGAAWVFKAEVLYDGAFALGDYLRLMYASEWPQHIKDIQFFNRPLTETEIETF